jgi:hypothetical protein
MKMFLMFFLGFKVYSKIMLSRFHLRVLTHQKKSLFMIGFCVKNGILSVKSSVVPGWCLKLLDEEGDLLSEA